MKMSASAAPDFRGGALAPASGPWSEADFAAASSRARTTVVPTGKDGPAGAAGAANGGRRLFGDFVALGMNLVLLDFFLVNGLECSEPDVERDGWQFRFCARAVFRESREKNAARRWAPPRPRDGWQRWSGSVRGRPRRLRARYREAAECAPGVRWPDSHLPSRKGECGAGRTLRDPKLPRTVLPRRIRRAPPRASFCPGRTRASHSSGEICRVSRTSISEDKNSLHGAAILSGLFRANPQAAAKQARRNHAGVVHHDELVSPEAIRETLKLGVLPILSLRGPK